MIRKGIIVVLMLTAIAWSAAWVSTQLIEADSCGQVWYWDTSRLETNRLVGILVKDNGYARVSLAVSAPEFSINLSGICNIYEQCFRKYSNNGTVSPGTCRFYIIAPLYVYIILFATYPTIAFIRGPLRRYRRRRKGLCMKCGYNLTGNTTGICSECGNKVE